MHFQSWPIFNLRSPSSKREVVARVVEEFLGRPNSLALDVGGTEHGFRGHLQAVPIEQHVDLKKRIRIVNPKGSDLYAHRIEQVPREDRYDLIMIFGTIMYMSPTELGSVFAIASELLHDGGTLLVADPDGGNAAIRADLRLKKRLNRISGWLGGLPILGKAFSWRQLPEHIYGSAEVSRMLTNAGFQVKRRPDLESGKSPFDYFVLEGRKANAAASHAA